MEADLRSDTVTKPSPAMLEAMMHAKVGDDVFEEDPTVIQLEQKLAAVFGKEAGLFCPSGTMANQIGINVLTKPGDEIICDKTAHVYRYEGGGLAFHSGLSVCLIEGDRGRINAEQVLESIRPDDVYSPHTSLVTLENSNNRSGGSIYRIEAIQSIREVCNNAGLKMHLDGARIFNALTEADYSAMDIGKEFDTISVCLSKGLGAPAGSVLLATSATIKAARKVRKVMGGGMRQSGYLAAACLYALEHNVSGLKEDHKRAKELENTLAKLTFVEEVLPVDTNIVVTRLNNNFPVESFIQQLAQANIKCAAFGPQTVRMVTHLDFNDQQVKYVCEVLKNMNTI